MNHPSHFPRVSVVLLTMLCAMAVPVLGQTVTTEMLDGLPFREIGPVSMSGRVVDLAVVESNPYTFYVAAATGGVWKTTNNGVTFTPVFVNEGTHSVGAIAVHQQDTNIVWVGTGERASRQSSSWGDGIYKSTDGGSTWTNLGLRDSHHIGRIALHPTNTNVAFVAAMGHLWGPNEERGLYVTRDGGASWTRALEGDENTGAVDVAIDPHQPEILYAALNQRRRRPYGFHGGGPGSGLYKSTDGGRNWRALANGLPSGDYGRIGISIHRNDPRIVIASVEQGWRYNASTAYNERRAGVYRSEDRGETWQHMSDWNPRPMYASQPLIDPSDPQRVYMMNAYSYSDDGGRTFTEPDQSLHGDDRIVWVNPNDSRHIIKGDDGGLGISYDRGVTWLYMRHLPISQFYRVAVDMRDPYWVYGGLQDNGSWAGPNATYRTEGILFDDWIKTGGGDGFLNLVDTTDNRTLYTESQYLGLSRLDLVNKTRQTIRPDDARGSIAARRNWDAWGPGTPEPELGNAMAPANWDGPFAISAHDHRIIYAGTNRFWKSTDQGRSWTDLGDLTTGVNRRELLVMHQRAHDSTLSLDDGIPYYPTLSAIAESPLNATVLYAGTDDGNLQVSRDGGASWTNVAGQLPGLPDDAWVNGLEASRHAEGTVYVAVNNYRNDDFTNYVYRSTDFGDSWTSIAGDLPARRVARTIREDLRNPRVLYLGTELGLFYTNDGGVHWVELRSNMPMAAFNDLVIHPRDNDLVLGTHGRGIWILDQINALQELTPDVLTRDLHMFTIEPARTFRYEDEKGHTGDMIFHGANPPAGAIVDYYLPAAPTGGIVSLTVHDAAGQEIARLEPRARAGLNRAIWDLHHADFIVPSREEDDPDPYFDLQGPWVLPGRYVVRIRSGSNRAEREVLVREDPRLNASAEKRDQWHATLMRVGEMARGLASDMAGVQHAASDSSNTAAREILPLMRELRRRVAGAYGDMMDWPGAPTTDQEAQIQYYADWIERLQPRIAEALRR